MNSAHEFEALMSTLRTASMRGRGSSIPKSRGVRRSQRIARTLGAVHPNPRNAKRHPRKQIDLLSESIRQLGFNVPIIVDEANVVLAGHGRYAAARQLGFSEVPIIRLTHLSAEEQRLFALADNKLPELGSWDFDQLK